ncbi:hypothetical protein MBLNU230_g7499t1 [Neophaeotheca triangularis]
MDNSPMASLSAELRNHIYSYIFDDKYATALANGKTQHAICQTSRQLRQETLAMYYANTRFNAHLDDGPSTPLVQWLSHMDREMILSVREISLWDMHNLILQLYTSLSPDTIPDLVRERLCQEWQQVLQERRISPKNEGFFRETYGFEYRMVPICRNMTFNKLIALIAPGFGRSL